MADTSPSFSPEQIEHLNLFQADERFPSFKCQACNVDLIPIDSGMSCNVCDFLLTPNHLPSWIFDKDWKELARLLELPTFSDSLYRMVEQLIEIVDMQRKDGSLDAGDDAFWDEAAKKIEADMTEKVG